jgi:hypothetical protein
VPPFVGVEGSTLGNFDSFTANHKSPANLGDDDDHIEIEPLNDKSLKAFRENESILMSIALRYSVAPGVAPNKGRRSPRRLSYYSIVDDTAMVESKRQSVLIPFEALWRLLNDFGVCPEIVK